MTYKNLTRLLSVAILCLGNGAIAQPAPSSIIDPPPIAQVSGNTLSLSSAIQKALATSPRIKSSGAAMMASTGDVKQAGLRPNPELGIEAENIFGSKDMKGLDSAEITYGVSQLIEIGGKRSSRVDVAARHHDLAHFDYQALQLDIIRDVAIAYAEAVAAKEQVNIAREQKNLSEAVLESVSHRVGAAREPLIQRSKAEIVQSASILALDKAERDYTTAKKALAVLWGESNAAYDLSSDDFFALAAPQDMNESAEAVKSNPDFARWDAELAKGKAALSLEKAQVIPDPTISLGVRDFRENNEQAFVAGISIPLPVHNLNQGNISRAGYELNKAETDRQQAEIQLISDLGKTHQALMTSYQEANTLKNTILPAAENAFSLSRQGYQVGKFPYLEVLDAHRTLFDTRQQLNEALKSYHISRAELDRLTAKHLSQIQSPNEASHGQ